MFAGIGDEQVHILAVPIKIQKPPGIEYVSVIIDFHDYRLTSL